MARVFNGTTSDVLSGTPPSGLTYPCTIAYWGKTTTNSGVRVGVVLGNGNSDQFASLYMNGATASLFNQGQDATAGTVSTDTWFHHAGVLDNANSRTCWLNGSAGTTNTGFSGATDPGSMYVGQGADGASLSWSGDVAEVGIWNVSLTAAEIASLADGFSPLLVRPSALRAYIPIIGRFSPELDLRGNSPLTVTGTAASAHPRIFMPQRQAGGTLVTAGGGGGGDDGHLIIFQH